MADALIYDRAAIAAVQTWRLWTGHLVHLNSSHLFWDLAVFLPAGIWLECIASALTRWFYALTPLLISCLLWMCEPTLRQYAGLSGVATGLLVLLALVQTRRDAAGPRWFWPAVLLLVAFKVIVETLVHAPLLVRLDPGIRTVPLAHVAASPARSSAPSSPSGLKNGAGLFVLLPADARRGKTALHSSARRASLGARNPERWPSGLRQRFAKPP